MTKPSTEGPVGDLLSEARQLSAKAQLPPWTVHVSTMDDRFASILGTPTIETVADYMHAPDAEFIARCRELVPALADALEAAQQRIADIEQIAKRHGEQSDCAYEILLESVSGRVEEQGAQQ